MSDRALSATIGVLAGPVHIGVGTVVQTLLAPVPWIGNGHAVDSGQASILWSLRFPRVILGAIVGGMLATAGAAYQGVFRNPLADPYLLGAAAGANLGATLAIAFAPGSSLIGVNVVPLAGFVGAVFSGRELDSWLLEIEAVINVKVKTRTATIPTKRVLIILRHCGCENVR